MGYEFEKLWNHHEDFGLPEEEGQPNFCPYARRFNAWAEQLCAAALQEASVVAIHRSLVFLVDRYWAWYVLVPTKHRTHTGASSSHTCIFHVFQTAYERLKVVELALAPPPLVAPQLVVPDLSPPPPPQIAGIFIGEVGAE